MTFSFFSSSSSSPSSGALITFPSASTTSASLNVSRSALQNDGFVKKISDYISKKVADKLSGMCKTEKEEYEKYWDDISPFIKFGCLKDDKFCEKMTDYI